MKTLFQSEKKEQRLKKIVLRANMGYVVKTIFFLKKKYSQEHSTCSKCSVVSKAQPRKTICVTRGVWRYRPSRRL